MHFTRLEKILEQLPKYNLVQDYENIKMLIFKLNEEQINYFVSLDIGYSKEDFNTGENTILTSDYYFHDLILIYNSSNKFNNEYLLKTACNGCSLLSEHHESDMELIANANTEVIASCLCAIACNTYSLLSKYHTNDMKLIANAKTDTIAKCLNTLAHDEYSLISEHHESDMELIANAKTEEIAEQLMHLALNPNSLINRYHRKDMEALANGENIELHLYRDDVDDLPEEILFLNNYYRKKDEKLIANARTDTIAKCLNTVAGCPYSELNSLLSKYHEKDMELIANSRSDIIAKCLSEIALETNSLLSEYHEKIMELIFNAKTDSIAKYITKYYQDAYYNFSILFCTPHEEIIELLARARTDTIAECLFIFIYDRTSILEVKNLVEYSKFIANIKSDAFVECLLYALKNNNFYCNYNCNYDEIVKAFIEYEHDICLFLEQEESYNEILKHLLFYKYSDCEDSDLEYRSSLNK